MHSIRFLARTALCALTSAVLAVSSISAQVEVIELRFLEPDESLSFTERTLQSMVRARGISETYSTGGLYLLTQYGDRQELFERENQRSIENPFFNQPWRFCSIFSSVSDDDTVILGRNWDNQNVGSVIVSLNHPLGGYSSITISRAIDLGFPENLDLVDMRADPFGERFLLAPFYCMDGINEHGLCIAVAGVRHTVHSEANSGERIFITFLIRKILDQTRSVEEAVELAGKYVPFMLDEDSLDGHLYLADASGRSAILEYENDRWLTIPTERSWQALTNKPMYEVPDEVLRESCWRYRSISETLEASEGKTDWTSGLQILRNVTQAGTTWSAVYSPTERDIYLVVYQNWDKIYHIKAFQP